MDRRLALVVLWAVFAAASVGVGFAAAGLVGDPFTDGVTDAAPVTGTGSPPSTTAPTSAPPPTGAEPPGNGGRENDDDNGGGGNGDGDGGGEPRPDPPASTQEPASNVTRSISTRAGFVSATCRSGLVRVSGSPNVGWQIEDIDSEPQDEARVRFERSNDGDGRVEVEAVCVQGSPRFELDDDD